jgi:hypothetical protein
MKAQANIEIKDKDLSKVFKKENLKFVGFISEQNIPKLKKRGYYYCITKSSDIMADVFETPKQNVYIYKKKEKNEN